MNNNRTIVTGFLKTNKKEKEEVTDVQFEEVVHPLLSEKQKALLKAVLCIDRAMQGFSESIVFDQSFSRHKKDDMLNLLDRLYIKLYDPIIK